MKFAISLVMSLMLSAASNASPQEHIELTSKDIQECFTLSSIIATRGPIGKLSQNENFELSVQYPNKDIYEVRLTSKTSKGFLIFLGVPHVTSPNPELFQYLENTFDQAKPSESYIEVSDVSYLSNLPKEKDAVIKTRGEPSYLGFIARKHDVTVLPLEPKDINIYKTLREFYSADQIVLTLVLREAQLSRDRQQLSGERLEEPVLQAIKKWNRVSNEAGDSTSIVNILELTRSVTSIWPGFDWRLVPADWFNPLRAASETGGVFTNEIIAVEKSKRDRHYADLLLSQVNVGKGVVALAGRNHAYTLGIGLQCLLEMK